MSAATGPTARNVVCFLLAIAAVSPLNASGISASHGSLFDRFYSTGLDDDRTLLPAYVKAN